MRARKSKLAHKHFQLDANKLSRAKKLLGAKTERETIERALDELIEERERNRRAWAATLEFLDSGAEVDDVFGRTR